MGLFDIFRKKNKPQEPSDNATRHCFVICKDANPGDLSQANKIVAEVLGPGLTVEVSDSILSISKGDQAIGFLAHLPMPIPNDEAAENADGNILWPDGKSEAAQHRSHVIVTTLAVASGTPVQAALAVAKLALVALKLYGGIGVYWGSASVTNSRAAFESFCEDMSEEHVPLPVLLRFQLVRAAADKIGIYTLGMDQFGLMNIEVDDSPLEPQELFEFVSNIAHYLVQSGPVIADGNTVGGSPEERILVRHRPSMIDPKRKVYKIVFG